MTSKSQIRSEAPSTSTNSDKWLSEGKDKDIRRCKLWHSWRHWVSQSLKVNFGVEWNDSSISPCLPPETTRSSEYSSNILKGERRAGFCRKFDQDHWPNVDFLSSREISSTSLRWIDKRRDWDLNRSRRYCFKYRFRFQCSASKKQESSSYCFNLVLILENP